MMRTVVDTPSGVWTVRQQDLVTLAINVVQQNVTSSRTETIVGERHAVFPGAFATNTQRIMFGRGWVQSCSVQST